MGIVPPEAELWFPVPLFDESGAASGVVGSGSGSIFGALGADAEPDEAPDLDPELDPDDPPPPPPAPAARTTDSENNKRAYTMRMLILRSTKPITLMVSSPNVLGNIWAKL